MASTAAGAWLPGRDAGDHRIGEDQELAVKAMSATCGHSGRGQTLVELDELGIPQWNDDQQARAIEVLAQALGSRDVPLAIRSRCSRHRREPNSAQSRCGLLATD